MEATKNFSLFSISTWFYGWKFSRGREVRDLRLRQKVKAEMQEVIDLKAEEHREEIRKIRAEHGRAIAARDKSYHDRIKDLKKSHSSEVESIKDFFQNIMDEREKLYKDREAEIIVIRKKHDEVMENLHQEVFVIRDELNVIRETEKQRAGHIASLQKQLGIFSDKSSDVAENSTELLAKIGQFQNELYKKRG